MIRQVEQLADVRVDQTSVPLERRSGIRPFRSVVRVARLVSDSAIPIVLNYGHGGAGVSLSWGCADEAIQIVESGCRSVFELDNH